VKVVRTVAELKAARAENTGFVPTMGALHAGHVSLLDAARHETDHVVMSLFVNEAQFSSAGDFARYPRDEQRDLELAERAGVDIVFAPAAEELYPPNFRTWVEPDEHGLEAAFRPGHFRAVATVCLKLFNIARPRLAYFGQKDAQQVEVVRRMILDLDLDLDVELRVLPTVRDPDGLALSSRNALLTPEQRNRALALPRALQTRDPARARDLLNGVDVDYVEVADFEPKVLAGAIRVGSVRLIDNVPLEGEHE
jgi:pantoate--beta-alanine ligase